ncbi:hypothetical protein KY495_00745 [Massilia sp. PAMC28688]|uniref:hypothetical protein n=1 Tax=Massilia sp. PAMC28688 TaxID=2861283 RepID=UPI001C630427|nr:hypothetical protein [Massilia sp. PAMC28688]QYF93803.1 hypothetical protein KY495_00745 [Massilia sp. PAMC28688]
MNGQTGALAGAWTHSFEEDQGSLLVFRPSQSFPFPPSRRGRETLAFDGDEVTTGMPGPDDRTRHATASVTALAPNLVRFEGGERAGQTYEVVEASGERLMLRPQ